MLGANELLAKRSKKKKKKKTDLMVDVKGDSMLEKSFDF